MTLYPFTSPGEGSHVTLKLVLAASDVCKFWGGMYREAVRKIKKKKITTEMSNHQHQIMQINI